MYEQFIRQFNNNIARRSLNKFSKGKISKIRKCYLKGRERELESDYLKL